jgi:GNAT superfamily N-acetyltransferase
MSMRKRLIVQRRFRPPLHQKMSFEKFERLPRFVGWKYEYYGGKAHISLSKLCVKLRLRLRERPGVRRAGIRKLALADGPQLLEAFAAAFKGAIDYADYSPRLFKKVSAEYMDGFFGAVRGERSTASVVAEVDGMIIGAAFIKIAKSGPLLDCLLVRPGHRRQGWATALALRAERCLLRGGHSRLHSYVKPANDPSLAWHASFGFKELPDAWIAQHRWRVYTDELERLTRFGAGTEAEIARLNELVDHWGREAERLDEVEKRNFWAAHPR